MQHKNTSLLVQMIKKRRKENSATQAQMSRELNISLRIYQRLENGAMPAWMAEELCDSLGLKVLVLDKEVLK